MHGSPVAARSDQTDVTPTRQEDRRFRTLMSPLDWARLPGAVRARFSSKAAAGQSIIYFGHVVDMHMSSLGWLIAQACRLIGAPLPLDRDTGVASVVAITEDMGGGDGQIWTRLYARVCGFPQVIHSSKRFAGPTGLEEHVKGGVGMTLRVTTCAEALIFTSDRYFFEIGRRRLYLPAWLTLGQLTVRHTAKNEVEFYFALEIDHPRFGRLIQQVISFEEMP